MDETITKLEKLATSRGLESGHISSLMQFILGENVASMYEITFSSIDLSSLIPTIKEEEEFGTFLVFQFWPVHRYCALA